MLRLFIELIAFIFLGYTLLGKGFAYLGIPPLYAAELVLLLGLLVALLNPSVLRRAFAWPVVLVWPFVFWSLLQTLPYLGEYGLNALRDAAFWGYSLFAFLIFGLVLKNHAVFFILIRYYRYFALLFPLLIIPAIVLQLLKVPLPSLPGSTVPLVALKFGDTGVHLAGVVVFVLLGLVLSWRWAVLHAPLWVLSVTAVFGFTASANRGGTLSFVLAVMLALASLFPRINGRVVGLAIGGVLSLVVFALISLTVLSSTQLVGSRPVSVEQIATNLLSIVLQTENDAGNVNANRRWRLMWWEKIVGYTVYGPYFWTGKGYGINLATVDGFQVDKEQSLRSPHNSHMTVLARSGVPGLALWLLMLVGWAWVVLKARWQAARNGDYLWSKLFVWLFCYWMAFLVNASFDVFLEGPMGGVPFWLLMGLGFAAVVVYANPASRPLLGRALGQGAYPTPSRQPYVLS
ncbi:O-antigen ligase family protein [Meiothermus rufus]|uniref:O-antigen ligase family protein n=1 Tax=Meiothermus rufus TaxID=604332 RepID=UPI0003FAFA88|nr:O-antigen ligase family protein [Meiothermus rufus]